ncbi:zinc-finger-containing protein [Enterobacter hormaechei]|uniref:zinc-finger-containing protein n=1 Tax=Enterobacter hormaechei TaxID=158836 RepID=UPI0012B9C019|nr:zinc-finger-containing protein [Enterobacter hormaechei]
MPLGALADKPTRDARKSCKLPFERIWKSGAMTRTEAYQWLADKMDIPVHECHFGWFTVEQCHTAMHHCNDWLNR